MYFIPCSAVLASLVICSAAPLGSSGSSSSSGYSVTILNDSSVGDLIGTVHTWLKLQGPSGDSMYFSFNHVEGATWKVLPGISDANDWLKARRPTESYRISINRKQYKDMVRAIDEFYRRKPNYSLFPEGYDNSYNCVTAANAILRAGGIRILEGYLEPVFLGWRLATSRSLLDKCLLRPNLFRLMFGSLFHKTLCLIL